MAETPMQGLAEYLRGKARGLKWSPDTDFGANSGTLQRWASEVEAARASLPAPEPKKLWLWKNFVDGRPEYWAFDNAYPINLDNGDPQTLGEPCGYALFKPSRTGRTDVSEEQVLRAIARARPAEPTPSVDVLRQEERRDRVILAAKAVSYSNGFDAALPDKKAELYEALKALERP